MSKIAMPEPVLTVTVTEHNPSLRSRKYKGPLEGFDLPPGEYDLITTNQAEAYAADRVREALERAVEILDEKAMDRERATANCDGDPEAIAELRAIAWQISDCARAVRALIPPA